MNDDPRIDPADLRNVRFPGSSRRYDARAVDQFLETVAARVSATNALVDDLRHELTTVETPPPVEVPTGPMPDLATLEAEELIRLVGEETASVLSTARRASEDIRTKAERTAEQTIAEADAEAQRRRSDAEAKAADVTARAEQRAERLTTEAEERAERLVSDAETDAARILADARADAERRVVEAWAEADRVTDDAQKAADRLRAEAEQYAAESRADADRLRADARKEADRIVAEARAEAERDTADAWARLAAEKDAIAQERVELAAEAESIIAQARDEGRSMVDAAKQTRTRILDDLRRRRDAARRDVEVLLAGRERLLAAYDTVRQHLEDVTDELVDAAPDPTLLPGADQADEFLGAVGADGDDADETGDDAVGADTAVDGEVAPERGGASASSEEPVGDRWARDTGDIVDAEIIEDDDRSDGSGSGPEPFRDRPGSARTRHLGRVTAATRTEPSAQDVPVAPGPDETHEPSVAERPPAPAEPTPAREPEPAEPEPTTARSGDQPAPAPVEAEPAVTAPDAETDEPEADETGPATEETAADQAASEATADTPDADEADAAVAEHADGSEDADDLFNRLREARQESVARAQQVLGFDADADADADDQAVGEPVGAAVGAEVAAPVDEVPAELLADDGALERRAEDLGPLEVALNRVLKRQLADEQNTVLDRLRRDGVAGARQLLPSIEQQVRAYAEVAEPHLAAAAVAGAAAGSDSADVAVDVSEVARSLGRALAEPLRDRVERSASEVSGDADDLDERLRALYREWKVHQVGAAADDALLGAYALGTLAASSDGRLRWRIGPGPGSCADCVDNADAGVMEAGEPFPSGHAHPQAHPGCRCLLVAE